MHAKALGRKKVVLGVSRRETTGEPRRHGNTMMMGELRQDSMTQGAKGQVDSQVKGSERPERKDDRSKRTGTIETGLGVWRQEKMIHDEATSGQASAQGWAARTTTT